MNLAVSSPVQAVIDNITSRLTPADLAYLDKHADTQDIILPLLKEMLENKPKNTEQFAARYFSTHDHKIDPKDCLPLLIVGPSGCGKVSFSE